ncbi:hypothetical protein TNCT_85721 [Trichonephila clavata]|uniref:Uncharacterized protein n=1 Tax=Trichonephila clavata TaxID=2740835 RepID=A0A8X6G8J1_TRICU|nr:hypothetical protein TNCT_85721 [Trichonephila clavata]
MTCERSISLVLSELPPPHMIYDIPEWGLLKTLGATARARHQPLRLLAPCSIDSEEEKCYSPLSERVLRTSLQAPTSMLLEEQEVSADVPPHVHR